MRNRRDWHLSFYRKILRRILYLIHGRPGGGELPAFKLLQLYPPFLFLGVRVDSLSKDGRVLTTSLPLRWYSANFHGTHFGGNLCAWSDPFPALMCSRIFQEAQHPVEVWTKDHRVEFRKPALGRLTMRIQISDADLDDIRQQLAQNGKATRTFEIDMKDASDNIVAHVVNTVYIKSRKTGELR